jgi:hypothetical protein
MRGFRPILGQLDLTEARSATFLWPSQAEAGTRIIRASPTQCRSRRCLPPVVPRLMRLSSCSAISPKLSCPVSFGYSFAADYGNQVMGGMFASAADGDIS